MKTIMTILIFSSLILSMSSCKKTDDENIDFYKTENRIGLWISYDKRDTLEFVNDSDLIRKGDFYVYERYLYRIEGKTLFIRLPDSSYETQHPILTLDGTSVVLGNMYITTGFTDNSGKFFKAK